jgi:hypothetical protein
MLGTCIDKLSRLPGSRRVIDAHLEAEKPSFPRADRPQCEVPFDQLDQEGTPRVKLKYFPTLTRSDR